MSLDTPAVTPAPPQSDLVDAFAHARRQRQKIESLAPHWELPDEDAGIRTMLAVAKQLGWPRLGWKIAATNEVMQKALGTQGPVFGMTFSQFLRPAPAVVAHEELVDPIIECEFAFRLGRDLDSKDGEHDFDDVAAAIESAHPCIEIAECRFPRDALPPTSFGMADGFAGGWYVLGDALADWRAHLKSGIAVQLRRNGELHSRGHSNDVMGHPLRSVVWLANMLRRFGHQLRAGDLVSSGTWNILCDAHPGDRFEAVYSTGHRILLETPANAGSVG